MIMKPEKKPCDQLDGAHFQSKKEKEDKLKLEALKQQNDKRSEGVSVNLKDLKYKQKEMISYYD